MQARQRCVSFGSAVSVRSSPRNLPDGSIHSPRWHKRGLTAFYRPHYGWQGASSGSPGQILRGRSRVGYPRLVGYACILMLGLCVLVGFGSFALAGARWGWSPRSCWRYTLVLLGLSPFLAAHVGISCVQYDASAHNFGADLIAATRAYGGQVPPVSRVARRALKLAWRDVYGNRIGAPEQRGLVDRACAQGGGSAHG